MDQGVSDLPMYCDIYIISLIVLYFILLCVMLLLYNIINIKIQ